MNDPRNILLFVAATVYFLPLGALAVSFDIDEEIPSGSQVGTLDSYSVQEFSIHQTDPEIFTGLFTILNNGTILLRRRLDRESVCADVRKPPCQCSLHILAGNQASTVTIFVHDINDRTPTFPQSTISIRFPEEAMQTVSRPIYPLAVDNDAGRNGTIEYKLSAESQVLAASYGLVLRSVSTRLLLDATQRLDREVVSRVELILLAIDQATTAPKTGSATIVINIADLNDHPPVFADDQLTQREILENVTAGTRVFNLSASDADEGDNGRVHFRISPHDKEATRYFAISTDNKYVYVRQKLDVGPMTSIAENRVIFTIIAEDRAATGFRKSSELGFQVDVIKVADGNSKLKFKPVRQGENTLVAKLAENSVYNTIIGSLVVGDKDNSQSNHRCTSSNDNFTLVYSDEWSKFLLKSSYKFDREVTAFQLVKVSCTDSDPITINVTISDVNDNAPIFSTPQYRLHVAENQRIGTRVLGAPIRTTDADLDRSAEVIYSLFGHSRYDFTINPISGTLSTNATFDRESQSTYEVQVIATDRGKPPLSSSANIIVKITDVNDSPPQYHEPAFDFAVLENASIRHIVGSVKADDEDTSVRSQNKYWIYPSTDVAFRTFAVDNKGYIRTLVPLDREAKDEYTFQVIASDRLRTSMRATAEVTIRVQDVNDNTPRFVRPNASTSEIRVDGGLGGGETVYTLTAVDRDQANTNNSRLRYRLQNSAHSREFAMFEVDRDSGWLILRRKLGGAAVGRSAAHDGGQAGRNQVLATYRLRFDVCDSGWPRPLCSLPRELRVHVVRGGSGGGGGDGESPYGGGRGDGDIGNRDIDTRPLFVIIVIIVVVLLISILVIIVIAFRKRIYHRLMYIKDPSRGQRVTTENDSGYPFQESRNVFGDSSLMRTSDSFRQFSVDLATKHCRSASVPSVDHISTQPRQPYPNNTNMTGGGAVVSGATTVDDQRGDYQTVDSVCGTIGRPDFRRGAGHPLPQPQPHLGHHTYEDGQQLRPLQPLHSLQQNQHNYYEVGCSRTLDRATPSRRQRQPLLPSQAAAGTRTLDVPLMQRSVNLLQRSPHGAVGGASLSQDGKNLTIASSAAHNYKLYTGQASFV